MRHRLMGFVLLALGVGVIIIGYRIGTVGGLALMGLGALVLGLAYARPSAGGRPDHPHPAGGTSTWFGASVWGHGGGSHGGGDSSGDGGDGGHG